MHSMMPFTCYEVDLGDKIMHEAYIIFKCGWDTKVDFVVNERHSMISIYPNLLK